MHHAPFGDRVEAEGVEAAVGAQPRQKIVVEGARPGPPGLRAQVLDVAVLEAGAAHPVEDPFQPGVDAVTRLMRAVIGIAAEEVIELDLFFVQAHTVIHLGHRDLVVIGEQHAVTGMLPCAHEPCLSGNMTFCALLLL